MNNKRAILEIRFKTKKLQKQYEQSKEAIKAYGIDVAMRYVTRVNIIKSAKCFEDLCLIAPLRFHQLTGNREGQYPIYLNGFYRLIITNDGDGNVDIAKIEEVSKHYGD